MSVNMGVARAVASRYTNRGLETEDLFQVAYAALTRAARDFDPGQHDESFPTPCPPFVGRSRSTSVTVVGQSGRPDASRKPRVESPGRKVRCGRSWGVPETDRGRDSPCPARGHGDRGHGRRRMLYATSLDRPVDGLRGVSTLGDLIGDVDPHQAAAEARALLAPVVLAERDRRILYLRYFEELSQEQIGQELGVSQVQVSRLLSRILRDLRAGLGEARRPAPAPVPG